MVRYRQLKQPLRDPDIVHVGEGRDGVGDGGDHPLLEQAQHQVHAEHHLEESLHEEPLADACRARKVELITQGGRKQEVEQVLQSQVLGVLGEPHAARRRRTVFLLLYTLCRDG